jgi:hypothetical protein
MYILYIYIHTYIHTYIHIYIYTYIYILMYYRCMFTQGAQVPHVYLYLYIYTSLLQVYVYSEGPGATFQTDCGAARVTGIYYALLDADMLY